MSAVESQLAGDDGGGTQAATPAGQQGGASVGEPAGSSSAEAEEGGGNAGQDFGWEGCKENVKPLKRGRKVDAIHAGAFGGGLGGGGGGDSGCSSSARVLADLKRYEEEEDDDELLFACDQQQREREGEKNSYARSTAHVKKQAPCFLLLGGAGVAGSVLLEHSIWQRVCFCTEYIHMHTICICALTRQRHELLFFIF